MRCDEMLVSGRRRVHACRPIQQSGALQEAPCGFPDVLPTCPLTYTLLMKACMSRNTADRPSFAQMLQIFTDMNRELSQDRYVDSTGTVQARPPSTGCFFRRVRL